MIVLGWFSKKISFPANSLQFLVQCQDGLSQKVNSEAELSVLSWKCRRTSSQGRASHCQLNEELCTWPPCRAVMDPALTDLCTSLGLFRIYDRGFIQTVCAPVLQYSATTAHSALQPKWMCLPVSCLLTHKYTFAGIHTSIQAFAKNTQSCSANTSQ